MTDQLPNWLKHRILTQHEQVCLAMRVPKSRDSEIDLIIREGNRMEFAKAAMQGLMSNSGSKYGGSATDSVAHVAVKYADALLAELEKTK